MSRARLGPMVRFVLATLLLGAIFHIIFCNEAQLQFQLAGQPGAWDALSPWQQRHTAWTLGPVGLWSSVRRLDLLSLLSAFLLCGVTILAGALRWHRALQVQGLDVPRREVCRISLVAHFFNAFLLGSTGGDVVKAWYAAKLSHHKRAEAAVTVFADRLIGTAGLLFFAVVMIPWCWRAGEPAPGIELFVLYRRYQGVGLLLGGMLLVAVVAIGIGFYSDTLAPHSRLSRFAHRLPLGDSIARGLAACHAFGRAPGFLWVAAGYSLVVNVAIVGAFLALARGLGFPAHAMAVLWFVVPAVTCVAALPITPSGLGVREHLFVALLTVSAFPDVKHADALSLSLISYTVHLSWSAIGGLVYLFLPDRLPAALSREPADS